MACCQADHEAMTKKAEETTEISPAAAEETLLAPADKDTITPPIESEPKEMVVSEEEKEKAAVEKEEEEEGEEKTEAWPIIEDTPPDASVEAAFGGTDFTHDEDEDDEDDD